MFQVSVSPLDDAVVVAPSAVVGAVAGVTTVIASLATVPVAAEVIVADAPPPATAEMVEPVVISVPMT